VPSTVYALLEAWQAGDAAGTGVGTGEVRKQLRRALQFAEFLARERAALVDAHRMEAGDRPLSLFEGLAGPVLLFLDLGFGDWAQLRHPGLAPA
jgi:hypothetical protein